MRYLVGGQRGTSTLEVIAALILFSLAAAGLAVVLPMAYGQASIWRDQYNVSRHLEQHLETLRGQTYSGIAIGEQTVTEEGLSCRTQTSYVKEASDGKSWVIPGPASGDGWFATYFDNMDFTGKSFSRIDPNIEFNWGTGSPVSGFGNDTFSARWTGWLEPPATGNFIFTVESNEGSRLWLNEQLIIDHWDNPEKGDSAAILLNSNQKYAIKMEYHENNGHANAYLRWSGPGIGQQIIPRQRMYSSLAKLTTVTITNAASSVTETGKMLTFHNNLATNSNKVMYVYRIEMEYFYRWIWFIPIQYIRVRVAVNDGDNNPLPGVTVNGQIDFISDVWWLTRNQSVSGVTGSNGVAIIEELALASSATFTVTNLVKDDGGYIYQPERNNETEES
ncbi:MAG TPA: PA14 domain-containing protein, partial [Bacillota bacterium]|nr:PA14 domain-containing protein [Bacillota bacterium]